MISKRSFLFTTHRTLIASVPLAISLLSISCSPSADNLSATEQLNILFLFSDDQRADAVGAYGNPYIKTPNIDRLASAGFNFRETHVMGSHHGAVCAPSRAMLLSGRSLFHVYDNLDDVDTLPQLLRETGYRTFGTGKWHQSREAFRKSFSDGERVFFGGMSDHNGVPSRDMAANGFTEVDTVGFSTTLFTDAAIRFLDNHAASESEDPFFAWVSFTAPHDPRTPPDEYLDMYPAASMPLPPNYMPVHPFHNGWMTGRDEKLAAWPRTPEVIRAQLGEYYGLITHLDAEIGRILGALESNGLAENTIVVFAGDNGLAVGSHGLLGKQSLYEHSTRVPMLIAGPGIPSGESDALVYLYDLFPTLAGLTGLSLPDSVDGLDLSGVWGGSQEYVRETLFTAYEDKHRAVRDGHWKLIRYPLLDFNQLFDLNTDPFELQNLADAPEHQERLAAMTALLEEWQQISDDPHPLTATELQSMEFDYSNIVRNPDRHQPDHIVEKYFDN